MAVRKRAFGVSPGEAFGLLGHNGAGKTTTMRIVTAEEAPMSGRVRVGGVDVASNASPGLSTLGYCPQVSKSLILSLFLSSLRDLLHYGDETM